MCSPNWTGLSDGKRVALEKKNINRKTAGKSHTQTQIKSFGFEYGLVDRFDIIIMHSEDNDYMIVDQLT